MHVPLRALFAVYEAAFRTGGSVSSTAKSDLIDNRNDEEGTHDVSSSKGKELYKLLSVSK